ncbi:serine O-acetyltransferase [Petropleomorpha daqingensis]|uniref:serine O-acetyltransferase n=1 Tax=Petropleomorpha daqingensis TaxID=2026353 RepID=UPI0015C7384F
MFDFILQDVRQDEVETKAGVGSVLTLRTLAVVLFRLSQAIGRHSPVLAGVLKQVNQLLTGADVAWQASIGPRLSLYHPAAVVIGPYCVIGARCKIQSSVTIGGGNGMQGGKDDSPTIGDDVAIGPGARILGPVSIGRRVLIGANAVVTRDVPEGSFARGVPARSEPLSR